MRNGMYSIHVEYQVHDGAGDLKGDADTIAKAIENAVEENRDGNLRDGYDFELLSLRKGGKKIPGLDAGLKDRIVKSLIMTPMDDADAILKKVAKLQEADRLSRGAEGLKKRIIARAEAVVYGGRRANFKHDPEIDGD